MQGEPAPHADWISQKSLQGMLHRDFEDVRTLPRNCGHLSLELEQRLAALGPFAPSRAALLNSGLPHLFGLDLYCVARHKKTKDTH